MRRGILAPRTPFLVGANYWASHAGHRMWERWDATIVDRDLALAQSMGLNALRTFFWSPQLNPRPGVVDERVLSRFSELLDVARRRGIGIFPTFFVGHMSGIDWDIPWRQGRDFCADPYMVYWETDLVRRVVGRFRGHPAILGWILTNELPNYTGSLAPETATTWTRAMYQAVKEADPAALVSAGDGARCEVRPDYDGFRVEWVRDHVDWIGVHLYNYFAWETGDSDELRKSYHIPCRLRYVDVGRPVLLEEFGLSDLICGREEAAGYYRSVLWSALANGACGALAWCLTDFDLSDEVPYSFQPHELTYGFATSRHEIKGQGRVLAEFARLSRELRFDELQMKQPREAIWVPYAMYEDLPHHRVDRLRSYRALEQAFTLAKMAGLSPDFVRTFGELAGHGVLFLPAGARLKAPEWSALERWVHDGGTVLYTYTGFTGGVYAQNFESLFGCRQRIRFGQLDQHADDPVTLRVIAAFGGLERGEEIRLPLGKPGREGAHLPLEAAGARVLMEDGAGRPALLVHEAGAGRAFFCTYPLEYMLLNTPDANLNTAGWRIYGAVAAAAGAAPRFAGKHPWVEVVPLHAPGRDVLVVINHVHRPVAMTLQDRASGAGLEVALGPKGVRLYKLAAGRWLTVPLAEGGSD
jgi:endo-1,4-beta-mannosidase